MSRDSAAVRIKVLAAIVCVGMVLRALYAVAISANIAAIAATDVVHPDQSPLRFALGSGVLLIAILGLLYRWSLLSHPWSVAWLACCFTAVNPYLMYDLGHAVRLVTLDGLCALSWLLALIYLNIHPRSAKARIVPGLLVLGALAVLARASPFSWPWDDPIWRFWKFAAPESSLRHVLVAYLTTGPLYGLAIVGAVRIARTNWTALVLPLILIAFTWWQSVALRGPITRGAIVPILSLYASVGFWHVYEGLGRTRGHGILAVDPLPEKRT